MVSINTQLRCLKLHIVHVMWIMFTDKVANSSAMYKMIATLYLVYPYDI